MFRPVRMRQVNIFVLEEHVAALTIALGKLGTMHIVQAEGAWSEQTNQQWRQLADAYGAQQRRLERLLERLGLKSPPEASEPVPDADPTKDAREVRSVLDALEDKIQNWHQEVQETQNRIQQRRLLAREMALLEPLDISLDRFRSLENLYLVVGTLPQENLTSLTMALFRIVFVIVPVYRVEDRVLVFAASAPEHAYILDRALESAFFERLELPEGLTGHPTEMREKLEKQIEDGEAHMQELEEQRDELVENVGERLRKLWRKIQADVAAVEQIREFGQHGSTYLISGWVPEEDLEGLVSCVKDVTEGNADIEVLEPRRGGGGGGRGPTPPTLFHNPAILQPFENVVTIFGFSGYRAVDPTLLVALTFLFMYGMMFGDIGHGSVLAISGLALARFAGDASATTDRTAFTTSSLGSLMFYAGASGTLFGVLYGSVFGLEDVIPHLWLNPFTDIQSILIISIVAGAVLLNVGFVLHLINAWAERDWPAILVHEDGIAGIWLYWALLGGFLLLLRGSSLQGLLIILTGLLPAVVLFMKQPLTTLLQGESAETDGDASNYAVQAFFRVFEIIISDASNTLSFVRLGAFAVAHAALSSVVFTMAALDGAVLRWIVILVGTLLILGLEGLVVGIQTLRLEYYEFFGKFYEGDGLPYRPFQLASLMST